MDIRDYFRPGGHKPVDQSLAERTVSVLTAALEMVNRGYDGNSTATRETEGDYFLRQKKEESGAVREGKEKGEEEDSGGREGEEMVGTTAFNSSSDLKNLDNKLITSESVADGTAVKEIEKEVEQEEEEEEWKLNSSVAGEFVRVKRKGDVVSGSLKITIALDHLLGPMRENQESECKGSVLQVLRDEIGSKEEHCSFCSAATRRNRSLNDVDLEQAYSP